MWFTFNKHKSLHANFNKYYQFITFILLIWFFPIYHPVLSNHSDFATALILIPKTLKIMWMKEWELSLSPNTKMHSVPLREIVPHLCTSAILLNDIQRFGDYLGIQKGNLEHILNHSCNGSRTPYDTYSAILHFGSKKMVEEKFAIGRLYCSWK